MTFRLAVLTVTMLMAPALAVAGPVRLDAATQARLQIRTAPIGTAHTTAAVDGFATVQDPSPLLQLLGDLTTAEAAATASQAEAARTAALAKDATVSTKTAEAAKAQAVADQAKAAVLKQRLAVEWGAAFARLPDSDLSALAHDLAMAQAAIVRVDTPSGAGLNTAKSAVLDLGPLGSANARVLGIARTADARLQSPGLITLVTGSQAAYLSTGLAIKARLYGGGISDGVLIPNAALLRSAGQVYAWVKTGPFAFDKRAVHSVRVTADGLIVQDGFRLGDTVVVQGASALLAAETPHAASAAKDGDD
ncbi:hypothetical protein [Asticcacaulis solisilvae]|uniref:hypothetical protein n=1 Tax=Asticcacaulis solisilvae TaxID=1217274 RepID=UPI003FD88E67